MTLEAKHHSEEDKGLSELLATWQARGSLSPRFQEQVWHRISKAETRKPKVYGAGLLRWLETVFARPALAISYVTLLLFVGLGAGLWQAHDQVVQSERTWRARYMQMVDPYQMADR